MFQTNYQADIPKDLKRWSLGVLRFQPFSTMPRSIIDNIDDDPYKIGKLQKCCIVSVGTAFVYIILLITSFIFLVSVLDGWDHNKANWNWWMYVMYLYISGILSCVFVSCVPFCLCSCLGDSRTFLYPGRLPSKPGEIAVISVGYGTDV